MGNEGATVSGSEFSFFRGFTTMTWVLAINNAIGGLLVALVIKYADNILRGFASSLATINCALISVFTFGFALKPSFGVGTIMVVGSTLLYGNVIKMPFNYDWWNSECQFCAARQDYQQVPTAVPAADGNAHKGDVANGQDGVELNNAIGRSEEKA